VTIEAAGTAATAEHAVAVLAPGGQAVLVGMPPAGTDITLPARLLHHGRTVTGTVMGSVRTRADIPRYANLILRGQLHTERLITSRYPLSAVNEAFDDTRCHRGVRAVITFKTPSGTPVPMNGASA
jgi:S-(hydroxymethyl)glutathione dehydrogenase/alcohol dehydrogenase